jgi:hypothetical protein
MQRQIFPKVLVLVFLLISWYVSLQDLWIYLQAVRGHVTAQWQFAFCLAPIPVVFGAISFTISWFVHPRLSKRFIWASAISTAFPILLFTLVWFRVY